MLFHPFVRVKIPERFIFVSALALKIFPYYTFICKFKIQFLKHFKNDENAFYFISKAPFVLKIFEFLSWLFGHVAKRLDEKDKVNF